LALSAPDDHATGLAPSPTLSWHAANGGPSGIDHYELVIDGTKNQDVPPAACSADACSATPAAALAEGTHTWSVRAVDGAGNRAETGQRSFASGSPPTASFTIAPNPALVGRSVTFDAAGASDSSGPIAHYEWDLDGDGSFETDTGTTAQATKTYTRAGSVTVQLRVTDGVGLTDVATGVLTVTSTPISGQLGVTINNGAQYTNTPNVTLNVAAPPTITQLLVSNDGGFLAATPFAPARTLTWKLDSSGPERLPKIVYLRFLSGATTSPNYTDDIILDERPPVVNSASVVGAPPAASGATASKLKTYKVKVKAKDSNSGVGFVQVTANKRKPGKLIKYKTKVSAKLAARPKFLRARDRAGNFSKWKKLR
jgi:PKD repeat protein